MKVSALKTEQRVETTNDRILNIQQYGKRNDFPQRIMEIVGGSVTGQSCVDTYSKFIFGRGFAQEDFFRAVVNSRGDTADDVLRAISNDKAMFGGFALHVNYNALYEIVSVAHVPFEWLRFEKLDDNYKFEHIALHPDWGKRYQKLRRFKSSDIVWFDLYDPTPAIIASEVEAAGGWDKWKGQILYYSNRGNKCYPLPIFDAAVTDMSAEEGLSNVMYRNIRKNFLPAGMFIDHNNKPESEDQENQTKKELTEFQGDTEAGKMLYINLQDGETAPEFKPFEAKNTDQSFKQSTQVIPDRIGASFRQPPILRAKDVGSNFGATAMREAYEFYNSQTETDRLDIERVMREVFSHYVDLSSINPDEDYSILPKVYEATQTLAERLGDRTDKALDVLFDTSKPLDARKVVLEEMFGIEPEKVERLTEKLQ